MNANEIVKGLRQYAAGELLIHHHELMPRVSEAADFIESLQALLYDYITGTKKLKEQIARLQDDIDQAQLEKYQTAEQLAETLMALELISAERNRQDAIWGEQNHEPQYWVGILGEEFGEYCQAVNETVFDNGPEAREKGGYENMLKELVHVAAVAVSAIEALMRDKKEARDET